MGSRDPVAVAAAIRAAEQRLGVTVDGKYRITAVIGVGGMGVVYEAQHLFLARTVALKVLHPRYEDAQDAAQRFLREAQALGRIGHRAIVTVLDGGFLDGTTPYLVMERLVGENLAYRIQRRRGVRVEQAATVMREMFKGLGAAHAKGIIHCDLKPENVFLVDRAISAGTIKVLDFGVAKMVATKFDEEQLPTHAYGTPEYMAPEQLTGGTIEPRTDLYGAGAVAYEALSGTPPFGQREKDRKPMFMRILRDKPASIAGLREPVPRALEAFIMRLLSKTPELRPDGAAAAIEELDKMNLAPVSSMSSMRVAPKRDL
jgi:eukaryotic-like serine/threonine-protein kinase